MTYLIYDSNSNFSDLESDISVANFITLDNIHYVTDPNNTTNYTINAPWTRYNLSDAIEKDKKTFTVENIGRGDVYIRAEDGHHYSGGVYYQTYIRHSGDYDATGVGNGEPVTWTISPHTKVKIHMRMEYNTNSIKRLINHVIEGGL